MIDPKIMVWSCKNLGIEIGEEEYVEILIDCARKGFGGTIEQVCAQIENKSRQTISYMYDAKNLSVAEVQVTPAKDLEPSFH